MTSPSSVVRAFYSAIERGAQLSPYLASDARTIERPNLLVPMGRTSDRDAILAAASQGAELLSQQTYEIRSLVEHDNQVIARVLWTGVVARAGGPFAAGQTLTAHIAQFIRVEGDQIAEIETYDCYEPLA